MNKSHDGLHHIRAAEDRCQAPEIVGAHMQAHFSLHLLQSFVQKVRRAHRCIDGSLRMLNCTATKFAAHPEPVQKANASLQARLMFPPGHSPVSVRRAFFYLKQAILSVRVLEHAIRHTFFDGHEAPYECSSGRRFVYIFLRIVNEVSLTESTVCLCI